MSRSVYRIWNRKFVSFVNVVRKPDRGEVVTYAPPLLAWAVGRPLRSLTRWARTQRAQVQRVRKCNSKTGRNEC